MGDLESEVDAEGEALRCRHAAVIHANGGRTDGTGTGIGHFGVAVVVGEEEQVVGGLIRDSGLWRVMLDRMGRPLALSVEFQARSRLRGIKIWVDLKLGGWTNTVRKLWNGRAKTSDAQRSE